jgi:hypothetical protein
MFFFSCDAQCARAGTYTSLTQATPQAASTETARSGLTMAMKLTPLARIAIISEWRQKHHTV